jgi:hypothetical protein
MRRRLLLSFFFCLAATPGFAQSLGGKWVTDRPKDPDPGAPRRSSVQLELYIEDGKASGSIVVGGIGGSFDTFQDGKVSGKGLQFRTVVINKDGYSATTVWTVEVVDENTILLGRDPVEISLVPVNVTALLPRTSDRIQSQPVRPPQAPPQVAAAPASASVRGIVEDTSKARIPGVSITAINTSTLASVTVASDEAGAYRFASLAPGRYTLAASVPAFRTSTLNVDVGATQLVHDFTLEVAMNTGYPSRAGCTPGRCYVLHRVK